MVPGAFHLITVLNNLCIIYCGYSCLRKTKLKECKQFVQGHPTSCMVPVSDGSKTHILNLSLRYTSFELSSKAPRNMTKQARSYSHWINQAIGAQSCKRTRLKSFTQQTSVCSVCSPCVGSWGQKSQLTENIRRLQKSLQKKLELKK